MSSLDRIVVVVGPTASGKSALAVDLALALGGEVVNADAVQLFRGMDIGSAKITEAERRGVPHHLLDVLDVHEPTSVATFQRDARATIEDCLRRGVTPVLVGGSSLYVRAVIDDFEFPGTDPEVRERYQRRLETEGAEALHAELRRVAPEAADQVLPSNGRRLVRALEVTEMTGRPFVASLPAHRSIYRHVTLLGLDVPRPVLDERIVRRVDAMWEQGLVEEVRGLLDAGIDGSPTASRSIGYQQVLAMLRGEASDEEARAETVRGTRAFARRQDRMFHQDPRVHWLPHDEPDLLARALDHVARGGEPGDAADPSGPRP
ncbi:tRNA dimethylallyltransferase [Aeromicrobium sp. Leaf289]|uniref:tRNA (adenosine(37)-N6)-dimethylallyltransferase MiaA n=1 Tax=Aeromicrobium sp. Leaf289 TaxID=1736324 RepID=UPI0006FF52F9|nr:tRNA (adenosine(37)-N6)-dimethylallyltransferase MiaA [Aeromicrobium sp. Leaf289]KQP79784.1 tRNA dimethylallyltransferase [Aeromicrobium sp. Leaf289]